MIEKGTVTRDELCAEARGLGFDLLGIAPASRFPAVPAWSRSVIVLGMAALDPALDLELYIEREDARHWSKWAYERLVAAAARLALYLLSRRVRAQPLTYENSLALLDLRVAAVQTGLGVWGLNHLVITHRFGPRIRFGAVFADLELPADQPLLDYYCVSCSLCIAACPTGALGPAGFNRNRCIAEIEPDAAMVELQSKLVRFPTPHTRQQCTACIDACPVGKRLSTRFWGLDPV
jgi:epoxyqueuosine reductase QueG